MGIPQTWSESRPEIRHHAPRLGEHTTELLGEYGFGASEIEALLQAGVAVASAAPSPARAAGEKP
jgi:crotonobetainyl-CoA:carnitine CoA-transferase CaiB-like acyl-CoA transferase